MIELITVLVGLGALFLLIRIIDNSRDGESVAHFFIVKYAAGELSNQKEEELWDEWIEFIESRGLLCAGGKDRQHLYKYEIWSSLGDISEQDRQAVIDWITKKQLTLVSCSKLRTLEL